MESHNQPRSSFLCSLFTVLLCLLILPTIIYGAAEDTETENEPSILKRAIEFTTEKKDLGDDRYLTPIVAPFFAPESGLGIVFGGLYTMQTDSEDPDMPRSFVKLIGSVATKNFFGLRVVSESFFKNDTIRFNPDMMYRTSTDDYYGVGYDNGQDVDQGEDTTEYTRNSFFFKPELLYRVAGDFFIGATYRFSWMDSTDEAELIKNDPDYLLYGDNYLNSGIGPILEYDSRDNTSNAHQGLYLKLNATFYDDALGSDYNYELYDLDYRQFFGLGREGKTLALSLGLHTSGGDVPWSELPTIGGSHNLRGYSFGHYRDEASAYGLVEYRHQFLQSTGELSRHGVVGWVGYGAVGEDIDDFSGHGLPNVGVGYRYEVQERMNLRLDFGAGDDSYGVYLNILEAF